VEGRHQGRIAPKIVTPFVKPQAADLFVSEHRVSTQKACRIVEMSQTAYYRVPRPASQREFPRREVRHEPEQTQCSCGCSLERIGEDVSEKLDYTRGCSKSSAISAANGCAVAASG